MIRLLQDGRGTGVYIFYADVFLLQNCLMNAGILLVLGEVCGHKTGGCRSSARHFIRLAVVSLAGGVAQLALLCGVGSYEAYVAGSFLVVIPGMVAGAFGRARVPELLRRVVLGGVTAVSLGGFVGALSNLLRCGEIPVWGMFFAVFAGKEGIAVFGRQVRKGAVLREVVLRHRGRKVCCMALWDTGNRLREPNTGRPVHVISRAVYEKLGITAEDSVGLAGYCTLGEAEGILPLYEIEELRMNAPWAKQTVKNAVVACAGERLLKQKPYQVILHVEGEGE